MAEVVDILDLYSNIQGELKVNGRTAYVPEDDCHPDALMDIVNR